MLGGMSDYFLHRSIIQAMDQDEDRYHQRFGGRSEHTSTFYSTVGVGDLVGREVVEIALCNCVE